MLDADQPPISQFDLTRFHAAARMIEDDGNEGYYTCRDRFGPDIAGVLLVAFLRRANNCEDQWPPSGEVIESTNAFLKGKGLS